MYIRPSVDCLYRDGTVHISREMHKQCFITRRETTSGPLTLTPSLKGNKVVVGCGERLCSDPIGPVGRSQRYSYVTLERRTPL